MPPRPHRDTLIGAGLSFVAGYVDAGTFIALGGLFSAHVTGNFVLIGAELVSHSTGVLAKLLALPVFVLAVAATRLVGLGLERSGTPPLRPLLFLEAAVLLAFALAGIALSPVGSPDGGRAVLTGMLAVAAMGIQNGIGRTAIGHLAATTVMTVNVSQAAIDLTDRLRSATFNDQARTRLRRTLTAVGAFGAGALSGAFAVTTWSFWSMLLPAAVLIALICDRAE